jgi:hypothetical protein
MNRVERTGAGRMVVEMARFYEVEEKCFANRTAKPNRKSERAEATGLNESGDGERINLVCVFLLR